MSTDDVPGAVDIHNDRLAMGCWAEHEDGSLIFVESTELNRVVFSLFDLARTPPIEYREGMPEAGFKKAFSWDDRKKTTKVDGKDVPMIRWTWHDKTAFPWEKVMKSGISDGPRMAAREHVQTAAERIAESLGTKAREFDATSHEHLTTRTIVGKIGDKFKRALNELRN